MGGGGWLLFHFLGRIGPEARQALRERVARDIRTIFASHYTSDNVQLRCESDLIQDRPKLKFPGFIATADELRRMGEGRGPMRQSRDGIGGSPWAGRGLRPPRRSGGPTPELREPLRVTAPTDDGPAQASAGWGDSGSAAAADEGWRQSHARLARSRCARLGPGSKRH